MFIQMARGHCFRAIFYWISKDFVVEYIHQVKGALSYEKENVKSFIKCCNGCYNADRL